LQGVLGVDILSLKPVDSPKGLLVELFGPARHVLEAHGGTLCVNDRTFKMKQSSLKSHGLISAVKCEALLNHHLTMVGWSCAVDTLPPLEHLRQAAATAEPFAQVTAVATVIVKDVRVRGEAVHVFECACENPHTPACPECVSRILHIACTSARVDAFSRIGIVLSDPPHIVPLGASCDAAAKDGLVQIGIL
jgi:hypothetical protein